MLRSLEIGLSISDFKNLSLGMIYDLHAEKLLDLAYDENISDVYILDNKQDFNDSINAFFPIS